MNSRFSGNVSNPFEVSVEIAGLDISLDTLDTGKSILIPPVYEQFMKFGGKNTDEDTFPPIIDNPVISSRLAIAVNDHPLVAHPGKVHTFILNDTWRLWQNSTREFVFSSPHEIPVKYTTISPDFSTGVVQANFSAFQRLIFPVTDNIIHIFVNWLAAYGDFIMHASGVAFDGHGYCFVGESGAGKSTLVEAIAKQPSVTVLGEDQVIVRCCKGEFWMYGTPWHKKPAMCSPMGVPLKRLFFIERSLAPKANSISPVDAATRILKTAFIPFYRKDLLQDIIGRLALFAETTPSYTLTYPLGFDVWPLIRDA